MSHQDFLPEDYLERRAERRTNVFCLILFALVMGGLVAAFMVTDRQRAEVRQQQRRVSAESEEAAKRLEQLDQLQQKKQMMIRKAKVTSVLLERVPRSLLLAELVNSMPMSLSLLELQLETKVLQVAPRPTTALDKAKQTKAHAAKAAANPDPEPEIKPTQMGVQLVGLAPTDVQVAGFMTALQHSAMFHDVELSFSEEVKVDSVSMRKFRIGLKLDPQVDVRAMEPRMVRRQLKQNPMGDTVHINARGEFGGHPAAVVPVND